MKIHYKKKAFTEKTLRIIDQANEIIQEFADAGHDLTVRQLYYQFVWRNWLTNEEKQYKKLVKIVGDARLAGLISWQQIVDRTRFVRKLPNWETPIDALRTIRDEYKIDRWHNQDIQVEVWIEKDALIGVIAPICNKYRVPYFSCRGYPSLSEVWRGAKRFISSPADTTIILHLADHDPSGIDMSRDIEERLKTFRSNSYLQRIALNYDQIKEYNPPPNYAKLSDKRAKSYIEKYGYESWELDSMSPQVLSQLVEDEIEFILDHEAWDISGEEEDEGRDYLNEVYDEKKAYYEAGNR